MIFSGEGPLLPIIGIGDIVADLVVRIPGLPVHADDFAIADVFELEAGGTANFLIMAARLGVPAIAFGTLGGDIWGHEVSRILESESVDTSLVYTAESTTRALVLVDEEGQHAFIGKYGEGGACPFTRQQRDMIATAGALFASGYSLSEKHLAILTLECMRVAGEKNVLRGFDPGPAFADLSPDLKQQALLSTDILFMTEEELSIVSADGIDPLFQSGIEIVVIKLGENGCRVISRNGENVAAPGIPVPVKDTTAAGDSFAAGFLTGMIAKKSLHECAHLANAVGAAKVQKLGGGRNVPTLREVQALLNQD